MYNAGYLTSPQFSPSALQDITSASRYMVLSAAHAELRKKGLIKEDEESKEWWGRFITRQRFERKIFIANSKASKNLGRRKRKRKQKPEQPKPSNQQPEEL